MLQYIFVDTWERHNSRTLWFALYKFGLIIPKFYFLIVRFYAASNMYKHFQSGKGTI
jgi:hypothetical protein